MLKFNVTVLLAAFLVFGTSCNEEQIQKIDRAITDANTITTAVNLTANETPAGDLMPADWKLYAALASIVVSGAANVWQKVQGDLMKKTTKAIVQGIEKTGNPDPKSEAANIVKMNIKREMTDAKIFDKANTLIDKMKLGLI